MIQVEVRITDITHIPLLQPRDQASLEGINLNLSFFDAWWVSSPPIQRLLLFENTKLSAIPSVIQSLKSTLSATLQNFFVLASKLVYIPSTGDVVIDCSPSAVASGVSFVEAEADGDINRLIRDEKHDVEAFRKLVPELDTSNHPAAVFSVQVTAFKSGGLAVAFSIHHAVADGRSVWQFISAWSKAARQGTSSEVASLELPIFDRDLLRHPRAEEVAREIIRSRAPDLPHARLARPYIFKLERRTFIMELHCIDCLKQKILQLGQSNASLLAPSTFVAIAAHLWVTFVRSRNFNPADDTYIVIPADCRSRLKPPITERYFGNCVKSFPAVSTVGNLTQEDGILHASVAIQSAVKQSLQDTLSGTEDWFERTVKLPPERTIYVVASPRFKVYVDTDFGWGKPSRVELVSMKDGEIVLAGAKDGGGVQVSVCLDGVWFESFKSHFLSF